MAPNITETAKTVLDRRYYLKDKDNKTIEDWKNLSWRVANAVAAVDSDRKDYEKIRESFFKAIYNLDFLPNSPCLMNAGTDMQMLSACFVLPIEDSMESIFESVKNGALVNKWGGGTGYSFSRIRGKDSSVRSTNGVASGPVSFAKVFDVATDIIKQGGRRRGANMGVLRVDHPDIIDFISAKEKDGELSNFNFSVAITDAFMEAVKTNSDYDLIDPSDNRVVDSLNAAKIFDEIVKRAWKNGEPGVLFIDTANKANQTPHLGEFEATNPCWSGDTEVLTVLHGFKRFDELAKTGDAVWVYSVDDLGRLCKRRMFHPRRTAKNSDLLNISTEFGELNCTPNHNLFLHGDSKKFDKIEARKLRETNSIVGYRKKEKSPVAVRILGNHMWDKKFPVYNGTVEETHRYFVKCGKSVVLSANCGEQFLLPYEACNLGSINLGRYVFNKKVDFDRLGETVKTAVRFLDNVVDCNEFPIKEIEEMTKKTRKIGLGIMGLHDMLIQLEFPYDSPDGRKIASDVMEYINTVSETISFKLGEEKGGYPEQNTYLPKGYDGPVQSSLRNAARTSIQPTGTVSMIANCGSGCEPYFAIVTEKHVMDGDKLLLVNKHFESVAKKEGFFSDDLMKKIIKSGTVIGLKEIPDKWQNIFKTAQDIKYEDHIKMQACLQKHVCSSISKTINMSQQATIDDVKQAYLLGWSLGCKGLTVYRDGSRDNQVLNSGGNEKTRLTSKTNMVKTELPDEINAKRYKLHGKDGESVYIIVCFDESENPVEVFAKFPYENRQDLSEKSTMWTTSCRLASLLLRYGIPIEEIIKQLDRSSGNMFDLPAQLGKLLKGFMASTANGYSEPCPDCKKGVLIYEGGCAVCKECGWSKCV